MPNSAACRRVLILATSVVCFAVGVAGAQPVLPAVYDVTFDATWSAVTHPTSFPPNPHFSKLIGGTHDDQAAFWTLGGTASLGIKRMAEWGSPSPLDAEVQAAIDAGQGGEWVASATNPVSPGSVSATFTATPDFPLVTLVTMIAPSPDWFVGVNGLDLRDGDAWADNLVVDLYAYDAGTDSGASYTSSDQPTSPQDPIAAIPGAPFTAGVPLGSLTFTLQTSATDVPASPSASLRVFPNPFNPLTTVSFAAPGPGRAAVTVHDMRGRLVRTLWQGDASGELRVTWDGRDDRGRAVPSAAYLVRAVSGRSSTTTRAVLAR